MVVGDRRLELRVQKLFESFEIQKDIHHTGFGLKVPQSTIGISLQQSIPIRKRIHIQKDPDSTKSIRQD